MWIKHASTTAGVDRNSSLSGDGALPFTNVASQTSSITAITSTGITLSTSAYVNSNTITYRYVAWRANVSQSTPTFRMQTGGYTGNGASLSISGLGFAPDFVIIKPSTTAGNGVIFKTTSMIDTVDAYATATANGTGDITIDNDGFTVIGSKANTSGTYHTWIAFGGSDCSSTGNFCVGTYIGNGTSPRLISMVGFQPDMVIVKPSGATAPMWRSSSMPSNYAQYFSATKDDSAGAFFTTLASNGFNVGASLNTSSTVYFYIAFKNLDSKISVGSYSGTGVAQNVTVGFVPDFVMLKTNSTTGYSPIYSVPESLTKNSYYFTDTANLVGGITGLISSPVSGFSVDTNALCNASGDTIYWASFGGSNDTRTDSGQFSMARGTYTGTGSTGNYIQIDGLSFTPDLVIVKGNTTSYGVFRTSMMPGDSTAYLANGAVNFTGGIVSLDPGGFTIGTNAAVNTSGITYYWEAFGNAWNEYTNSGSSSFYIGTYFGNATDNVSVPKLPFAADMIAVKGNTAQLGVFRTSSQSGDLSSYFSATAETSNIIQAINSDGFQLGTSVTVNTNATLYYYFGFKSGPNFTVGTYTGSGATKSVSFGFQPDYMWIKHASTTAGVERSSSISGDGALPFTNVASQTSSITAITSTGITLSTSAYVNSSSVTYRYVAWRIPASSVVSISVSDGSISFGTINFGESQDTITLGDTQSVTNNGNVNVTIEIQGANTACPWTLASTVGNEQYRYDFSTNSGSVWTPLTTSYSVLDTGLTPTSSQNFDLRLWTPSSTTCTTQQTVSVTLLAVEE